MRARSLVVLALALAGASCFDPVHADRVDALGPEKDGVRPGPDHRPGQPCNTCHGGNGPGSPEFSVAGTVYTTPDATEAAQGVRITITASDGSTITLVSNSVGNFYATKEEWYGPFPMKVQVDGAKTQMTTRIGGQAGCGFCHRNPADVDHVPAIYLNPAAP